ncbi:MAG TPA: hypothetical protein VL462_00895 [Candidatus Nitrosotalea sp.]|jgi:hypothetical protein|nr:hypothetical protein [Candidatus Nitrosotalea sp.]
MYAIARLVFDNHSLYFKWPNIPHALEVQWHDSIAGYSLSHFTKAELATFDAFAWGHRSLTTAELGAFHEEMAARAGASDLQQDVHAYSPGTVDALVPYVQQGKHFMVSEFLYY